jgi:glucose-6-phosphate 1-dehydrogenase
VRLGLTAGVERRPARDQFVVKLDPSTGARLVIDAHRADGAGPQAVTMDVEFAEQGGEAPTPYEVLLHAAIVGDSSRFKRQDVVEENWRIMQPLIDNPPPVHPYAPGSWGPDAGSTLVADHGGWQGPWIESARSGS